MINLVCLDRDGTINEDNNYYLGNSKDWKSQVKIFPGVIEGIKRLNSTPNLETFVVTNQSGVALEGKEFSEFTLERMHEVNKYVLKILEKEEAFIRGYFACPIVDYKYAEKARLKGRKLNTEFVRQNPSDLKPNIGMIKKAAKSLGKTLEECRIYVIGDIITDVQLGLNAGGKGILVESPRTIQRGDLEKTKKLAQEEAGRVYLAKDFLDATDYIIRDAI